MFELECEFLNFVFVRCLAVAADCLEEVNILYCLYPLAELLVFACLPWNRVVDWCSLLEASAKSLSSVLVTLARTCNILGLRRRSRLERSGKLFFEMICQ